MIPLSGHEVFSLSSQRLSVLSCPDSFYSVSHLCVFSTHFKNMNSILKCDWQMTPNHLTRFIVFYIGYRGTIDFHHGEPKPLSSGVTHTVQLSII
jgi:hypothetical protein